MNTSELLEKLTQHGVQVSVDNDKLSVRSPKGVVTPELRAELALRKAEILELLREKDGFPPASSQDCGQGVSLSTIGCLIGGFLEDTSNYKPPTVDPAIMAQKLSVTFKPVPNSYTDQAILQFKEELEHQLWEYKVKVIPWEQATTEFQYKIQIPFTKWKKKFTTKVVKAGISAVIDVEQPASLAQKIKTFVAEKLYQAYSYFILKQKKISVSRIAKFIGWAEEGAAKYIEDPTNTQVIVLTKLDEQFIDPQLPYQRKIEIGLNTLVRTFSELVIGVSQEKVSILNMNLSDSVYPRHEINRFILNSLIPKIFIPIMPLPLSKFKIESYDPNESVYAKKLVSLGKRLEGTGLFPPGCQLSNAIKRKSHRDIVNVIVDGRTGVSYGFVAYLESPQYIGAQEITAKEWEHLSIIDGFPQDEIRQNEIGRYYIRLRIGDTFTYKQIPDLWLVSSRSGSNKTNLNLEYDVIRIGLKKKLLLQFPQEVDPEQLDIKPSYDVYVMLAIALSAALYTPELVQNGAPIVHFHGYPSADWFQPNEYFVGVENPSVPCGTYESGIFNFLGISRLATQSRGAITLASLIEPDHGTNIIASDLDYLVERLKSGCQTKQIELGGKHFASLKAKLENSF